MATIRKISRKSGFAYRAIIKDKSGAALKSKTFDRKADAKDWAKRVEVDRELMDSFSSPGAVMTFADLVDEYILQWEGKSYASQASRAAHWRAVFGHLKLTHITALHIRDALKKLSDGNVIRSDGRGKSKGRVKEIAKTRSPNTVNRYRALLSAVFRYAIIQGYVTVNPVTRVPCRKLGKLRTRYLDENERQRLLEACKRSSWDKLYLAVLMAMTTGMRKSELFLLRWCDIDFNKGLAMLDDTKNGEPRYCPVPDFVMSELNRIRQVGNGLIFPSERKSSRPFEFHKQWVKALSSAGINNFRWHDLRHTAASMLVMNGATLYQCGEILGHKSLETTKRYSHLSTEHKSQLVNKIMSKAVKL